MNPYMPAPGTTKDGSAPVRLAMSLLLLVAGPALAQARATHAAVPEVRDPVMLPSPTPAQQLDALLNAPPLEPLPPAPIVLAGSAVVALGIGLFFGMPGTDAFVRASESIHQPEAATFEATWAQQQFAVQRQSTFSKVGREYSAISALAAAVAGAILRPSPPPRDGSTPGR